MNEQSPMRTPPPPKMEHSRVQPSPTIEARAAAIEQIVHDCGRAYEDCRALIRDAETEYAAARTTLIDTHRRRFEDMQADANEQLRALDARYRRQIAGMRASLEAIARLRDGGNGNT